MPTCLLRLTVFLCGTVVMSFEILGSRILAPNFGNSVFVWGSLISTFLAGLSVGYFMGGKTADKRPSARELGLILAVPAFLLTTFPLYDRFLSNWIFEGDIGERLGPLLASVLLFFVPSVLLGAVSPYAAKLSLTSLGTSGSTIGSLYALSTLGSIAGTLLTSYYLITVAGVRTLIVANGILLLSVAGLVLLRGSESQQNPVP